MKKEKRKRKRERRNPAEKAEAFSDGFLLLSLSRFLFPFLTIFSLSSLCFHRNRTETPDVRIDSPTLL